MFKFRGAVGLIIVLATEVISEGAEGMTDNALKCQFNVGGVILEKSELC